MVKIGQIAARLLLTLLLGGLLGATLLRTAPGFGIDEEELDTRLNAKSIQALRENSAKIAIVPFYLHYLSGIMRGNLGISRTFQRPVKELLAERLPETLKSVGLALAIGWTLGLSLAIVSVTARSYSLDLSFNLLSGILLCIPAALMALLFVLGRAPVRLVLALVVFPKIFRYAQKLLAQSAALPHVLTARAKGAAGVRVLLWHILPTAAPQLLALAGVSVSLAFAASIPMEVLGDLPGVGQLAWKAAMGRDLFLLVNLTMVVTFVTVLANSSSELLGQALFRRRA